MELYTIDIRIVCLTVSVILYIIGMCGNSLIIWTFLRIKRLRIIQNVFVVNLAIVDLHLVGLVLPFSMYILITNEEPKSRTLCQCFGILTHLLFTVCLQLIMCIAISRYVKICHHSKFILIYTTRNVTLLTLACVFYWFIFLTPLFWIQDFIIFDKGLQMCNFDRFRNKVYTNIYILFCLVIPTSVTSVCYIKIYTYIRTTRYKVHRTWNNGLARQRVMHELTVTRSQFAVFVTYLILYMPFGISTMIGPNPDASLSWVTTIAGYMGFTNSCINSVLYGLMNGNIRKAYFEVLPCLRNKRNVRIYPGSRLPRGSTTTVL